MTPPPITTKELAWELGVSVRYVESMHAAGFPMVRRKLDGCGSRLFLTATVEEARQWIEANEFRLVHCHPVITIGQIRFGFGQVVRNGCGSGLFTRNELVIESRK
jgi:uncharacterized membrane protein YedE/YeeE